MNVQYLGQNRSADHRSTISCITWLWQGHRCDTLKQIQNWFRYLEVTNGYGKFKIVRVELKNKNGVRERWYLEETFVSEWTCWYSEVWVWWVYGVGANQHMSSGTRWSDLQNWPFCRSPCVHTPPCHTTTCFSTCLRWLVHWASVLLGLLGFFKEPWQQGRGRGLGIT